MKRTILVATAAVVAFGSGFTGATVVSHKAPVVRVAWEGGEACVTENGRSGYMVSSGRDWICQESGGA